MGVHAMFSNPQPTDPNILTPEEALSKFINSDGDLNLTAERTGCDRADIVAALSQNIPQLQESLRVLSIVNLSHEAKRLRQRVRETVSKLAPEDAMRSYLGMNQLINSLTDPKHSTIELNVNDAAFSRVPRHLQEVIVELERLEQEQARATSSQLVTAGSIDSDGESLG